MTHKILPWLSCINQRAQISLMILSALKEAVQCWDVKVCDWLLGIDLISRLASLIVNFNRPPSPGFKF